MDTTGLMVSSTLVAASTPIAAAADRGYRALSAVRYVTCPETAEEATVEATLVGKDSAPIAGAASLTIVNDAGFPTPAGLVVSADGASAFAKDEARPS